MTLQWIATPLECQNLRFSIKSMLGILVRRTSIPLRYLQLEFRASPHVYQFFRATISNARALQIQTRLLTREQEPNGPLALPPFKSQK